jgi:hypothetical protein
MSWRRRRAAGAKGPVRPLTRLGQLAKNTRQYGGIGENALAMASRPVNNAELPKAKDATETPKFFQLFSTKI